MVYCEKFRERKARVMKTLYAVRFEMNISLLLDPVYAWSSPGLFRYT